MALAELTGISKTYNGTMTPVAALRAVDLTLGEGEFVALMGPSGSGKSTLLAILGAMTAPSSGRVAIDGIDVYALTTERLADFRREYLGFVFQQLYLVPYLTAIENVMLPLAAARMKDARQREMAAGALQRVALADKLARLPRDLSGGEQQRVAIARAIVNRPPLLLADEPTGCLDSETGRGILELFHSLKRDGLTVLMVTHDASLARQADRIVRLRDGAVQPEEEFALQ
jgi:putative ABC transport system ATP-binding protein